jgi:hypothetical protein
MQSPSLKDLFRKARKSASAIRFRQQALAWLEILLRASAIILAIAIAYHYFSGVSCQTLEP